MLDGDRPGDEISIGSCAPAAQNRQPSIISSELSVIFMPSLHPQKSIGEASGYA